MFVSDDVVYKVRLTAKCERARAVCFADRKEGVRFFANCKRAQAEHNKVSAVLCTWYVACTALCVLQALRVLH